MLRKTDPKYGPQARNRIAESADSSATALAAYQRAVNG